MNIKYIGRNLLLVSMAIAMSACGGSKDDAPGNGVLNDPNYKTFVGFWEMSETCMDQLDESTGKSSKFCYENNNKNEMYEAKANGSLYDLENTKICQARNGGTLKCFGEIILKLNVISDDEVTLISNASDQGFEIKFTRITQDTFLDRQKFTREKLASARETLKLLKGKTLTLVKQIEAGEFEDSSFNYSDETPADQIDETLEYSDSVSGDVYTEHRPKVLKFISPNQVRINNLYTSSYDIDMYNDDATLYLSLSFVNGKLESDYSTGIGAIEIKGNEVHIVDRSEMSIGNGEKETTGEQITTRVYQIQ